MSYFQALRAVTHHDWTHGVDAQVALVTSMGSHPVMARHRTLVSSRGCLRASRVWLLDGCRYGGIDAEEFACVSLEELVLVFLAEVSNVVLDDLHRVGP